MHVKCIIFAVKCSAEYKKSLTVLLHSNFIWFLKDEPHEYKPEKRNGMLMNHFPFHQRFSKNTYFIKHTKARFLLRGPVIPPGCTLHFSPSPLHLLPTPPPLPVRLLNSQSWKRSNWVTCPKVIRIVFPSFSNPEASHEVRFKNRPWKGIQYPQKTYKSSITFQNLAEFGSSFSWVPSWRVRIGWGGGTRINKRHHIESSHRETLQIKCNVQK